MLRISCRTSRRWINPSRHRSIASSSIRLNNNIDKNSDSSIDYVPENLLRNNSKNPVYVRSPAVLPFIHPYPHTRPKRAAFIALSATVLSTIVVSNALTQKDDELKFPTTARLYEELETAIEKSRASCNKILHRMMQTGAAASVLWKSLRSLLSSANHEFELRVAAFLADMAAASPSRRAAIVGAGGGAVIDWLLETVATASKENLGTRAEAARALAFFIADPNVREDVLGRPNAIPNLLMFIFSALPPKNKKRSSSFDISDSSNGLSMLVAAIMDVVTSHCVSTDKEYFRPLLPRNAEIRDIAVAIEVIEEGKIHWDEPPESDKDDNDGKGMKGIAMKILEGKPVLGLSRTMGMEHSDVSNNKFNAMSTGFHFDKVNRISSAQTSLSSAVVPGLWDDLHSEHVAVPFAAWALANWAMASEVNRSHIQELDRDGLAVMSALVAPERSVKWHGSLVARLLLEDQNLPLNESVSDWCSSLLKMAHLASKNQDLPLVKIALSAFLVSIERSHGAREVVMKSGLPSMRQIAKQTMKGRTIQEPLAKALELLCRGELHMSLEEGQKWSGILLPWIVSEHSSDILRSSATSILSHILEDYGPSSIPVSQGWLSMLLAETLISKKTILNGGNTKPKNDIKTQIDQSNIVSATQIADQLATAVVNLAGKQLGVVTDGEDVFPLIDLLSLEPFAGPFKNLKKDKIPPIDAAGSAFATLKGIKALTEICSDDSFCQQKLVDYGVLCLLRRFLLKDDYEGLAGIEAYDASRALETQESVSSSDPIKSSVANEQDSSSLRVPRTAHIRRHAARLLTVLSVLPKVKKMILADETFCKWLEECASGRIRGCNDLKTRSYARATLLNVLCNSQTSKDSSKMDVSGGNFSSENKSCHHYADMIYLINPERQHWKCLDEAGANPTDKPSVRSDNSAETECRPFTEDGNDENSSAPMSESESSSNLDVPPFDVVFIHGLRGGPIKSWRLSEDKYSTKSGLVEKIDEEAGKRGTFWPSEWLPDDFPDARLFSLKYKTNLTQWSGASLPLQEVSSMLLKKLATAGIGDRPVVFVTHSMGGLVVKQMLNQAQEENMEEFVKNTIGVVFYSCPHFGSKLADMPWGMGVVLRPAPSIEELRSGAPRLIELNNFIRNLNKKGMLDVLSFSETEGTRIVEGFRGWAIHRQIVTVESAYPGYGKLVALEATDHVNSCKPVSRNDPSYKETLDFLRNLKARYA